MAVPPSARVRRCHTSPRIRIRRVDVTPEEWIAHRKLRKKIASARWYRKKKRLEIAEENRIRSELEKTLIRKPEAPIWTDERIKAGWQMSLDYMYRGYPPCPDPERYGVAWCRATRNVEEWLCWRLPYTQERGCVGCHIPWGSRSDRHNSPFLRTWRRLAMGEWWGSEEGGGGGGSGAYVGWTLSVVGAAFSAWHLQRERLLPLSWSDIAHTMYRVATASRMMDQYKPKPDPHRRPPHQKPTKNTVTTQQPMSNRRIDTLRRVFHWDDWIVWMNRNLFDTWEKKEEDDAYARPDDDDSNTEEQDEEEDDEEEDDTWMDDLLHSMITQKNTPVQLSLDHYDGDEHGGDSLSDSGTTGTSAPIPFACHYHRPSSSTLSTTHAGHRCHAVSVHGCSGAAHTESYLDPCQQQQQPWWRELPESSRWIYGISDPESSNGSDDPDSPDTPAEWSICV